MSVSIDPTLFPYQQLADRIRVRIQSGDLAIGHKLDPIRTIAEKEKLSYLTVSKALSSLATEGYLKKVKRYGIFVASADGIAAAPAARQVGIFSLLMPKYFDRQPSARHAVVQMQDALMAAGIRVSLNWCHWIPKTPGPGEYVPVEEFANQKLDVIVAAGLYDFHYLSRLAGLGIPIVAHDLNGLSLGMDSAYYDDVAAAFDLTKALLDRGHRNVAFVGGPMRKPGSERDTAYDPCVLDRSAGYRLAMRTFAPECPAHVYLSDKDRTADGALRMVGKAAADFPECTALVLEDAVDVARVGCGHLEIACFLSVVPGLEPITLGPHVAAVAECPTAALAQATVELVLDRLNRHDRPVQARVLPVPVRALC